jgi:hypothetical protein
VADGFAKDDSPGFYYCDTFDRWVVGAESKDELWPVGADRIEFQRGGFPVERKMVVAELVKRIADRDGDV